MPGTVTQESGGSATAEGTFAGEIASGRALVRAAKALNRSLETDEVLSTLCEEVCQALEADEAVAYLGNETDGYTAVAISGLPESYRGHHRAPGDGLGAQAARDGEPKVTHAYTEEGYAPAATSVLDDLCSAIAVPLRWDDSERGFVALGYRRNRAIGTADVELAEGFAELAALACANAERHAAVRQAAEEDALTGCLNQAAFRRALRRSIASAEREEAPLCLVLLDLDGFKQINDTYGHPMGDGVLRQVGELILASLRDRDQVARYGGDEFALVLTGLEEDQARPIIARLLASLADIEVPGPRRLSACAGLAPRQPGEDASELIERADRALLNAKRDGEPNAVRSSRPQPGPAGPRSADSTPRPVERRRSSDVGEGLQALAGRIGLRISRSQRLVEAANVAASELCAALEASECVVMRLDEDGTPQPVARFSRGNGDSSGPLRALENSCVDRCMRERRAVLSQFGTRSLAGSPRSGGELGVPVLSGEAVWGAIGARADSDPFGPEDAKLAEAVAEHLGTTVRAIDLNEDLRRSLIGTAESLAAALAAKDSYTAEHARSIAELAVAIGRQLELDEEALEDLRYAAFFHDIGKIAIPDAVLNKPGPLSEEEFELVKRHTVVGEEILAPVPFFNRVRRIVRHDHERWDGNGYPDGLRGEQIPIGARIVLVADAYNAMTSDRPYRPALSHKRACKELRAGAGTQLDPSVVEAFLALAAREPALVEPFGAPEELRPQSG